MKILALPSLILFFSFNLLAADSISTLEKLYPNQEKEFIKTRIKNSQNVHKFYRSFVRYYYSMLKQNPDYLTTLDSLKSYSGVVSGDPHVENFGFLVDKNHKAHFSFNDFDDADKSLLYLDLLRHLTSALMVESKLSVEDYLKTYREALGVKLKNYPDYLADLKKKAEKKGHRLSDDDVDADEKKFITYKKVVLKMSSSETQAVQKGLEELLKKEIDKSITIHEVYKRTKDSGGSAGLIRYQILLTVKDKLQWLELKEFTTPGTAYYHGKSAKGVDRLQLIKNNLLPTEVKDEFYFMTFQGKPYLATYIWDGEKGIDFQDIDPDEYEVDYEGIILLEVKFLGYLHGKAISLKMTNYKEAVAKTKAEDWKAAADKIIAKMKETYSNVKAK